MISFRVGRSGIDLFDPKKSLFALWLFLLVLPKGGFKVGGVPITWGYLLIGALTLLCFWKKSWRVQHTRLSALLCLLPFQFTSLFSIATNGFSGVGMLLSFFVSFFFLPLSFFFFFSDEIEHLDLNYFASLFKKGLLFVSAYGIFLFFLKLGTGRFLEIPFLTVNLGDVGELETKHINRGVVFKLISTYNNGNLYGICILMLLPLFCYLEKRSWPPFLVKVSLLLTLSRTVWIGLIFHELCFNLFINRNKNVLKLLLFIGFFATGLFLFSLFFHIPPTIFFDSSLGGRRDQVPTSLDSLSLLSSTRFQGIQEMVPLSILAVFGFLGLATFFIALALPIFLFMQKSSKPHQAIALGLSTYLLISCSDGAILLLPVLAFYWFLLSLMARKKLDFCLD